MATKKKQLVQLGVLMSKEQMQDVDISAERVGLSRSAYVRQALLFHVPSDIISKRMRKNKSNG